MIILVMFNINNIMNITIITVFVAIVVTSIWTNQCIHPNEGGELNDFISILNIIIMIRTDQYVAMEEEEFKLSDDDIKWLLSHTEYDDKELNTMLAGEIKEGFETLSKTKTIH